MICDRFPQRLELGFHLCAPTATRTRDLLLRRQSLYPLSYRGPTLAYRRTTCIAAAVAGHGSADGWRRAATVQPDERRGKT